MTVSTTPNDTAKPLNEDRDAQRWAREFIANFKRQPVGGIVVDEGLDPQDIPIEARINGEVRQSGNTKSMIHSFASLGEYLSRDSTLFPGDLISGGTPKGTAVDSSTRDADGKSVDDSKFLNPGDVVEMSSSAIGSVTNTVSGTRGGQ